MELSSYGSKTIFQIGNKQQNSYVLGEKSIYLSIKFGVPQGSLLGPLLFSIYINDMVNACNLSNPYLFADDGALLFENICCKTYLSIKIEMLTIIKGAGGVFIKILSKLTL